MTEYYLFAKYKITEPNFTLSTVTKDINRVNDFLKNGARQCEGLAVLTMIDGHPELLESWEIDKESPKTSRKLKYLCRKNGGEIVEAEGFE